MASITHVLEAIVFQIACISTFSPVAIDNMPVGCILLNDTLH